MSSTVHNLPQLSADNFNNWKFRVLSLLEEKQVKIAVEKLITQVEEKDKMEFLVKDAKAKSTIVQCITDKHLDIVKDAKTAKEMMKALQDVFERKSVFTKLTLKKKLLMMKCGQNEKLEDHFLKFDSVIRELESVGSKIDESDKVCHLLLSLNKNFDSVITAIETLNTEVTMDFVKSRLLDEEIKIHGKDQRYDDRNEEVTFKAFPFVCYKCGQRGHKSTDCTGSGSNRYRGNFQGRHRGRGFSSRGSQRRPWQGHTVHKANEAGDISFIALNCAEHIKDENVFILDSGATQHLVSEKLESYMTEVEWLTQEVIIHIANGEKMIARKCGKLRGKCQGKMISIPALIVKNMQHNLLSVGQLTQKGISVIFENNEVRILGNNFEVKCEKVRNLYMLKLEILGETVYETVETTNLWHRRLGHLNRHSLKLLGLPYSNERCEKCIEGKSTRRSFYTREKHSRKIGDLIHSDIAGPINPVTSEGEKYFQVLIDDYSHFVIVKLLKNKNEAQQNIMDFISLIKTQHNQRTRSIRVDNGGEFSSNEFKNYCRKKGIEIQYTQPYSPQQNGTSERMNRTLLNMVRTKLAETNLPKNMWGEALRCSAYELNRSPSSAIIGNKTPSELWYGKNNLNKLKVFGSKAWVVRIPKPEKLEARTNTMIMIGYCGSGYRLWDYGKNKIVTSTDVKFDEDCVQFKSKENDRIQDQIEMKYEIEEIPERICENEEEEKMNRIELEKNEEQVMTRLGREIKRPTHLTEYEIYTAYCFLCNDVDPQTYNDAIGIPKWNEAIKKEVSSLEKLETWTPSLLPPNKRAIDTKWVFKTKEDGTKKARLVAKGFQIKEEECLNILYAPVARIATIRTILAIATQKDWPIRQLDVPSAFLNGDVESEIYINVPDGVKAAEGVVLRLNKALYGLRESPKCWNNKFNEVILKNGFRRSQHDFCLYIGEEVWIVVYVDDIILTGAEFKVAEAVTLLKREFDTKDLGKISKFLGMHITRTKESLTITQPTLIKKIFDVFNMTECKGLSTPMEVNFQIDPEEEIIEVPYRQLIGSLMYLAITTRPDIMYAVSFLSRCLDKPTEKTWKAGKRIIRYVKKTQDIGLCYKKGNEKLEGYSDADWAGDKTDRKSTTGCVVRYSGNTISWFSKKQNCVALSTAEAEYIAGAASAQEMVYLKGILSDFNIYVEPMLYMDNISAISMSKTYENSKRGKHIDIKEHFIKDLVAKRTLNIDYVPSEENLADMFTKPLSRDKFERLRENITSQL